ncbi:hypothetical protein OIU79_026325 [Salix purpurea]|uniref:Uncharacterized protein n=1 Tax=Salix purpurea TaxID=77065 RepID=A0A9Q0VRR9_SALPP|nr:hypothetical protein OIU79_026325 [Salix purpurea]
MVSKQLSPSNSGANLGTFFSCFPADDLDELPSRFFFMSLSSATLLSSPTVETLFVLQSFVAIGNEDLSFSPSNSAQKASKELNIEFMVSSGRSLINPQI